MIARQTDILMGDVIRGSSILILKKSEESFFSYLADRSFFKTDLKYETYPLRGGKDSAIKEEVFHEVLNQHPLFADAWSHTINLESMRVNKALSFIKKVLDYSYERRFTANWRGKILIEFDDWKLAQKIRDLDKLATDQNVVFLDFSYPGRRFLEGYVTREFKKHDEPVTDKMARHFIKRLGHDYESYADFIRRIIDMKRLNEEKITTKMISKYTPYNKVYKYDDILEGIISKKTKQKQNQAISYFLQFYSPKYIIKVIINKITDLYYTKKAYVDGYATPGLVKIKNQAKNLPSYIPNYSSITNSAYKIEKNLRILENIPLKEIEDIYIYCLRYLGKRTQADLYRLVLAIEEREFYG